ncbi:MAG TPA: nicotianamine synthase family protein [Alphaproteobacteria bacterium]|nr:nicotianamine synthase family protein [Alphaproteobacteria bacterium]
MFAALPLPSHDSVSARVRAILASLLPLPHLGPQPLVDSLLGELVNMARLPLGLRRAEAVLRNLDTDGTLPSLHALCADAEYRLEADWARKVAVSANPLRMLRRFHYWTNYVKLARLEVKALRSQNPDVKRVLFVGAGPLPLSSYMLAAKHGLQVDNLDRSGDACACALHWLKKLPKTGNMACHHADVTEFGSFDGYDAVILAALVGLSSAEKKRLIDYMAARMKPEQLLLVRSVRGLRRLLYPMVHTAELEGFEVMKAVHPRGEVINSALVLRRK